MLGGGGEEREPGGVEQRAAVGGHAQVLERRAAVEGLAGGQQPVPGQRGGVEGLLALLGLAGDEAVELAGDAVALLEQLAGRQQAALLGEEQEHDAHHHRDRGLVGVVGAGRERVGLAAALRVGGRLGERLDQQLDRAADLGAEGFGDLLGRGDRFLEQHAGAARPGRRR